MDGFADNLGSIWFWVSLAWAVHIAVLSVWIVLQKREPVATLSWVLGLALLPVLGFIVYHFLGPQQIKRQRLRRIRSRAALADDRRRISERPENHHLGRLSHLVSASTGYSPSSCTELELLMGGEEAFESLLEHVQRARRHIHLEYYIFAADHTGTALRDVLVERARAGVRVRLLVDAVGSAGLGRRFLAPLVEAGGEVAWFHPLRLSRFWRPRWNFRTHRKIVVIDGRLGFTGGINITDEQDSRRSSAAYADIHMRLEGDVVRWLQLAFLEDWHYASGVALSDETMWPDLPDGPTPVQVVPSGPDSPWEPIHRLQVEAIHGADRRLWLATPYFVPGEAAVMALSSAAMRGVDVRLLVPRRPDSRLVGAAARSYYDGLLAAGVRIFEYQPRMMHAKALLADNALCIVGSANFDHRSFRLNFELSVMFSGGEACRELEKMLRSLLAESREVLAPRRTTRTASVKEAFARLLSPLL